MPVKHGTIKVPHNEAWNEHVGYVVTRLTPGVGGHTIHSVRAQLEKDGLGKAHIKSVLREAAIRIAFEAYAQLPPAGSVVSLVQKIFGVSYVCASAYVMKARERRANDFAYGNDSVYKSAMLDQFTRLSRSSKEPEFKLKCLNGIVRMMSGSGRPGVAVQVNVGTDNALDRMMKIARGEDTLPVVGQEAIDAVFADAKPEPDEGPISIEFDGGSANGSTHTKNGKHSDPFAPPEDDDG